MSEDLSEDLSAPVHIGTGFEDFICETNFISNTHLLYSFGRHQRAAESVFSLRHLMPDCSVRSVSPRKILNTSSVHRFEQTVTVRSLHGPCTVTVWCSHTPVPAR